MRAKINEKNNSAWVTAALCLALAMLGLLHFGGTGTKWMTLLAGFGVIALLLFGDRRRIWNAPSLLLLGYAAFSWVTIFWALSGKFHLREGSKILIAVFFFLLVAMQKKLDRAFARRVMSVIAGISALYAFMGVEAVTTGLSKALIGSFAMDTKAVGFNGERLYGIFSNSNIEASIYAVGIFCAIALMCGVEKKAPRVLWSAALFFNALAFLLAFSMGAMVCFAAAVVVYLIFAGRGRSAVLLRMLNAAIPALICAFLTYPLLSAGRRKALAVVLVVAALSVMLELTFVGRFSVLLEKHQKIAFGTLLGTAVCIAIYAAAAWNVAGPYTFGETISRSMQLPIGEHTLRIEADGEVTVEIYTQTRQGILQGENTNVYYGNANDTVHFSLLEENDICYFRFLAEPGVTLESAVVDGMQRIKLNYSLMPEFAVNRLQRIALSVSQVQREIYCEDALEIWRLSPIIGNGIGAFETGVTSVQSFPYETKYVHNHYLQTLLEGGVVGFALYLGALLTMLLALWKKRKTMLESELRWVYPALCAAFVMNGAQMCWDVSMSMIVFLCMTYAIYGLITGTCAEPFAEKAANEENGGKKKRTQGKGIDPSQLVRNIGIGFTAVMVLTLCGNLYADAKMNAPVADTDEFLFNLRSAVKFDIYERNDKMLSYVMISLEDGTQSHREWADEYAARLAKVQSNTIPRYLVSYYLQTQQYGKAIDEAILGATYSASNAMTWDACASQLNQVFFQNMLSPLLTEERAMLMEKLMAYYDVLQGYNTSAAVPVELDETAQAFFDKIPVLNACVNDDQAFAIALLVTKGTD